MRSPEILDAVNQRIKVINEQINDLAVERSRLREVRVPLSMGVMTPCQAAAQLRKHGVLDCVTHTVL